MTMNEQSTQCGQRKSAERVAMEQALESLENSVDLVVEDAYNAEQLYGKYPTRQGKVNGLKVLADQHKEAITALKEALMSQSDGAHPEPVAIEYWLQDTMESGRWVTTDNMKKTTAEMLLSGEYGNVYPQGRIVETPAAQDAAVAASQAASRDAQEVELRRVLAEIAAAHGIRPADLKE